MSRKNKRMKWDYVPLKERMARKAAAAAAAAAQQPQQQPEPQPSGNEAHRVGPQGQTPLCAVQAHEPRFNARKHNYTGKHVATTPEEESEFKEIFDGFAADYGLLSATHLSHIEEASKAKLQVRRIERDLPNAITETGYDSKKVVLMHRYLKEHRAQLRYALNALIAGYRLDYKRQVEDPARSLAAKLKTVATAIKSTETEFIRTNPNVLNELFKSAGINAAAPPPRS